MTWQVPAYFEQEEAAGGIITGIPSLQHLFPITYHSKLFCESTVSPDQNIQKLENSGTSKRIGYDDRPTLHGRLPQ